MKKIGVIAGGGSLPQQVLDACTSQGVPLFVVGIRGQTDPACLQPYDHLWVKLGQVGAVLEGFQKAGVSHIVLAGKIRRPSWSELSLDRVGFQWVGAFMTKSLGDDALLSLITQKLEQEGFQILSASSLCPALTVSQGTVGKISPTPQALQDIHKGSQIIHTLYGTLDIGQAVVLQEGLVLGVEAIEGTDALIQRCGSLKREGAGPVLIKLAKPGQNQTVDMPTVGLETIHLLNKEGFQGMAIEADATLVLDLSKVLQVADEAGCFVWGVERSCLSST